MAEKKKTEQKDKETPLMKQYNTIKAKYPDALLLFRVGDFYETFGEDAIKASGILDIVLTKRSNGAASHMELAGFPHHALDTYLPKLVRAGQRVAICDQLEDPKLTKTIVKRGITELVTPGISYNDKVLEHRENNFLASVHLQRDTAGISFLDISTGEFYLAEGSIDYIDKLLQSFKPSEVIVQKNKRDQFVSIFSDKFFLKTFEDWVFSIEFARNSLHAHFEVKNLKGYGVEDYSLGLVAAGAVLHYLEETHHNKVKHISQISHIQEHDHVWLDRFTVRNLEIFAPTAEGGTSLLSVLDKTVSPMGARLFKKWLIFPLKNVKAIQNRHALVELFIEDDDLRETLLGYIKTIGDIERLITKVSTARISPREMQRLQEALAVITPLKDRFISGENAFLVDMGNRLYDCSEISDMIKRTLSAEPPVLLQKGDAIASGISEELDEYRELITSGRKMLEKMLEREIQNTGISSLKVGYNNVFGYYLEVRNTYKEKVPESWHRKQTLVGSERYITEELKEYEQKILSAGDVIAALEQKIFNDLVENIFQYIEPIQRNAGIIAQIDVLLSFAVQSRQCNYVKPQMNESYHLEIIQGRHPVIEALLPVGENYIANDVILDSQQQIIIVTGPNMSGKSALLRQTALIVLLAQVGCFVPAQAATIGVFDKIFTRVGASDNIAGGESTFMVEMNETASILNNISNRSLILLDEIGRGTSTYDGISIAWSIAAFLHEHPLFQPKVLFATHYHELNEMAKSYSRIKNFHVSVKEIHNKILFLRKFEPGGSEHSFGIHVAKMAGMPKSVLRHAEEMLVKLEESHAHRNLSDKSKSTPKRSEEYQLSLIQLGDPLLEQIKEDILNININNLTPVEALMKLNEIKTLIGG